MAIPTPIHHWNFDEPTGNRAADAVGALHAKLDRHVSVPGRYKDAIRWSASDGVKDASLSGSELPPPWSVTAWVRRDKDHELNGATLLASDKTAIKIEQWRTKGKLGITKYGVQDWHIDSELPLGEWAHLAVVGTATGTKFYVNGTLAGTIDQSIALPRAYLGHTAGWAEFLAATLDELKIYDVALTAEQVKEASGQLSSAVEFNGLDGRIELSAALPLDKAITIEFWVKGGDRQPSSNSFVFGSDGGGSRVLNIHLPWGENAVYWDTGENRGGPADRLYKAATPTEVKGTWVHWAFLKDVNTGKQVIYKNGQVWHEAGGLYRPLTGTTRFGIGAHPDGKWFWPGSTTEFRVWNHVRTAAQIQADMRGRLQGSEPGLVLYYRLDGSQTTQTVTDASGNGRHGTIRGTLKQVSGPDAQS